MYRNGFWPSTRGSGNWPINSIAARAGIVSLNLGDLSSSELADALDRAGICARGGLHCAPGAHEALGTLRRGAVRLSVGHATAPEEIEQTLRVLREIAREA